MLNTFFDLIAPAGRDAEEVALADDALTCTLHDYQRRTIGWALRRERSGTDRHGICGPPPAHIMARTR